MTGLPLFTRLGNYELVRLLAQGGMADIYLARRDGSRDYVAIKVLNNMRGSDPESCTLFLDEARLLSLLDHNNLARVFEIDRRDGVHYLAMEYVHGVDLRELLAAAVMTKRAVPYETALSIVAGAASGLDHAHRRCDLEGKPLHLVHRDVSLSNIMVGHDGSVKVVDFGIAIATVSSHRTNPGIVRGKASYMSPEQALGDMVDRRTDVFALGVVLYELTTGRRCFQGNTDFERMLAVVRGDYVPPTFIIPSYPPALERIIKTALATDVTRRYPSAAAMVDALHRVALAEGWIVGATMIGDFMHELFGVIPQPWLAPTAASEAETIPDPDEGPSTVQQTVRRRRRLAQGTGSEPVREDSASATSVASAASASDDDDDEPTRGRRSVPKILVARFAA